MLCFNIFRKITANKRFLGVFPECVTAFCAPHKLRHRFVSASGLHHPHVDLAVAAFLALLFDFTHSADFVGVGDNSHEGFRFRLDNCAGACLYSSVHRLLGEAAFCAAEYKGVAFAGFFGFHT